MPACTKLKPLMFAPFAVAAALAGAGLLSPFTGVGPAHNSYVVSALVAIGIGLLLGLMALVVSQSMPLRWRILLGLFYVPTLIFSLIMAGV